MEQILCAKYETITVYTLFHLMNPMPWEICIITWGRGPGGGWRLENIEEPNQDPSAVSDSED